MCVCVCVCVCVRERESADFGHMAGERYRAFSLVHVRVELNVSFRTDRPMHA